MSDLFRVLASILCVILCIGQAAGAPQPATLSSNGTWQEIVDGSHLNHCRFSASTEMSPSNDVYAPYLIKIHCRFDRSKSEKPIEFSMDDVKVNSIAGRKFPTGSELFAFDGGLLAVEILSIASPNELGLKEGTYVFYGFAVGSAMRWRATGKGKITTVDELMEQFSENGYEFKSIGVVGKVN